MWKFATGFVIALLAALPAAVFILRKKLSRIQGGKNVRLKEFEELGKLTGELAHEIKNPLSTVKINLKLIREEMEDLLSGVTGSEDEQKFKRALRKLDVIQKESDRLEQILESFLRYVRETELQPADIDINELVGDMVDFYSPQGYSHSITIRQGLYGGPLVCKVDADMLKQVLLNLFINAQQAMNKGGELMVRTSRQKEYAIITVSDTGCGIAHDRLPHIFDVYYSSRPGGTGLGLPTARKIVRAHKGTIAAESEVGKGTSFTIKLPLCPERG